MPLLPEHNDNGQQGDAVAHYVEGAKKVSSTQIKRKLIYRVGYNVVWKSSLIDRAIAQFLIWL